MGREERRVQGLDYVLEGRSLLLSPQSSDEVVLTLSLPSLFYGLPHRLKNTRLRILLVPKPTYQNPEERRKTKKKARKRSSLARENRKSRASVIFLSLGG